MGFTNDETGRRGQPRSCWAEPGQVPVAIGSLCTAALGLAGRPATPFSLLPQAPGLIITPSVYAAIISDLQKPEPSIAPLLAPLGRGYSPAVCRRLFLERLVTPHANSQGNHRLSRRSLAPL
ncbi:hypothetical protein VTN96DRAFT_10226 [Rasamsonia emersonii]